MPESSARTSILSQPLIHFVAMGALVFAVHAVWQRVQPRRSADAPLVVSAATVEALRSGLARDLGHAPSTTELESAVDAYVDRELLYREARRLGLGDGDPIVRRRLIQKMQMVHEATDGRPLPTDDELRAFVIANPKRFSDVPRVAFDQLFFSSRTRSDAPGDAVAVLATLHDGTSESAGLGDPFVHGRRFEGRSRADVAAAFGADFANALFEAAPGSWQVIESAYGTHLVRLDDAPRLQSPSFESVRNRARADLLEQRKAEARVSALERLRHEDAWEVRWP